MALISPAQKKKEIQKCFQDPVYFINNYCKISHPTRGRLPLKLFDFQEELIQSFLNNRFNIILKARQLGISTVTAAFVCWILLFRRDKTMMVVATKVSTAANLVKKVQLMYDNIPDWLQVSKPKTNNRHILELENGSWIKAESTQSSSGRSEALSYLIIDEAAHVEGLSGDGGLWAAAYSTLSTGGQCIALSTPCGVGDWFHEMCMGAINGENGFVLTKLMWDVHPERDQAWFDKETRNMNRRQIAQELLCNFNASGATVLDPTDIEFIEEFLDSPDEVDFGKKYGDPLYKTHAAPVYDNNLWLWKEFNPNHKYLISADVARGDGKDFSTFHILDCTINHVVAEYKGQPEYDHFAMMLDGVGREWGMPIIVVEGNMLGYSVITELEKLSYPNIYYEKKTSHEYVEPLMAPHTPGVGKGFTTSMTTRPQIVAKMEEYIRNKEITIYSRRLLDEMKTFIWNNGKPEAMSGKNDDLVMSFAILCWLRDTVLKEDVRSQEHAAAVMQAFRKTGRTLDTSIAGSPNYNVGPYLGPKNKDTARLRGLEEQARMYRKYAGLLKG